MKNKLTKRNSAILKGTREAVETAIELVRLNKNSTWEKLAKNKENKYGEDFCEQETITSFNKSYKTAITFS